MFFLEIEEEQIQNEWCVGGRSSQPTTSQLPPLPTPWVACPWHTQTHTQTLCERVDAVGLGSEYVVI